MPWLARLAVAWAINAAALSAADALWGSVRIHGWAAYLIGAAVLGIVNTVLKPVLLDDWSENGQLLLAIGDGPRAKRAALRGLARRPRYDLAEFWNWNFLPVPTDPREATQHGRFYPAHGRKPAIFVVVVAGQKLPRLASPAAFAILARHGVPTRR